jgi:hypothetical protein
MSGGTFDTGDGILPATEGDFGDGVADDLRARVRSELESGERILWSARGIPRPFQTIRVFPALFAAFLCGASGFALMVLFGIYGLLELDPGKTLFLLCLAPAALGGMAVLGSAASWVRHRLWQRRIARKLYVLTDRRAFVVWKGRGTDNVWLDFWTADMFDGTLCIDHGDGTGSVFFCDGEVVEPESSFEGIRDAHRVEEMIRQVLLGEKVLAGAELAEL